ncbi:MAG: hypothetical protein COU31_03380 [Candidatus Magasanikbacteria bacterium CG10_big_fil_rev_8_21_14_0_10_40_10]|uniref:PKD domain-containing protein n=1 Tax=Candidatus Magasanikbacteria bacterium CG10_big_fil_rev_8_21_14_0_10_40_10 TaxID=1974648 RepID=A0A2M6W3R1_9BACT|nr:MAG: hypothetical protein COU31_03380 [Candidatus Magasanikbacteria bacterium CG10_big_fil_rev_8_21_14_0_10_40_10]
MRKKILFFLLIINLIAPSALAQTNNNSNPIVTHQTEEISTLKAVIKSEDFVQVNKKVIFDASNSSLTPTGTAQYSWDLGDGSMASGNEVVHEYAKVGKYNVSLIVKQGLNQSQAVKQIFIYDKKALLIFDTEEQDNISQIKLQAAENGVALQTLSVAKEEGGFLTEDNLVKEITKLSSYIKDSDMLIFYTKTSIGQQSFTRFWQNSLASDKEIIQKKFFVNIADGNLDLAANFSFQTFKVIQPKYILLTRKEALSPLLSVKDYNTISSVLSQRGIETKIVDQRLKKSPIFILSSLISYFTAKGVSNSSLYLILIIPFIACVVVFFRQIVGLSTFGIYTPVITAASFYVLGLWFGLATFLFAVSIGYLLKYLLSKFELMYLSKVALNLGVISLSFLVVVWLILYTGGTVSISVAVFPMLVMSSITEKFMAAQSEEGFRGAMFGIMETLIVVVASYYLIVWTDFSNVILSWPELALTPLLIIILFGKFSGLRISEYLRFRSLFSEHTEE